MGLRLRAKLELVANTALHLWYRSMSTANFKLQVGKTASVVHLRLNKQS